MANKQIVDYIKEAQSGNLKKGEIINNLKEAGWSQEDVKDAFAYINLYSLQQQIADKPTPANRERWISATSVVLGYLWLISGLNKILGTEFVAGFGDFVRGQIENSGGFAFYKNFLNSFVLSYAEPFATLIQYTEFTVGLVLIIAGLWNFIRTSKVAILLLCLASLASFLMTLNIILSLGMPLPWIDVNNVFAQGVSIEYFVLLLSLVSSIAYFREF